MNLVSVPVHCILLTRYKMNVKNDIMGKRSCITIFNSVWRLRESVQMRAGKHDYVFHYIILQNTVLSLDNLCLFVSSSGRQFLKSLMNGDYAGPNTQRDAVHVIQPVRSAKWHLPTISSAICREIRQPTTTCRDRPNTSISILSLSQTLMLKQSNGILTLDLHWISTGIYHKTGKIISSTVLNE